jgi:hypothetical protein
VHRLVERELRVIEALGVSRPRVRQGEKRAFGVLLSDDLVDLPDQALITASWTLAT